MINAQMTEELNKQINAEFYSAYLYLSMAAHLNDVGLRGFAHWMRVQAAEEREHAMKIYDYLEAQGEKVKLLAIEQPPSDFESPLDIFQKSLNHEREITAEIHNLVNLAISLKDHATQIFLQWFVSEQVEEEATAMEVVQSLKLAGNNNSALLMLDRQLGARAGA